jgi:hypothetical protein
MRLPAGLVFRTKWQLAIDLCTGMKLSCAQAVARLVGDRQWEVRSAGKGSKGDRWHAWALIGTASPRHFLLIRRHLQSGELAFHYCHIPDGQPVTISRLIRAAGLRWPVEEDNPGPSPTQGSRHDPADRARDQTTPGRSPPPAETTRPRRHLAHLAPPPPSPITLVPPTHPTRSRIRPGQIAIDGCRNRPLILHVQR